MNILVITLQARPLGGLEILNRDIALSLRRLGHHVEVFSVLEAPQTYTGWGDIPIHSLAPRNPLLLRLYHRLWRRLLAWKLGRVHPHYDRVFVLHPYAAISAFRAHLQNYVVWAYGIEVWQTWAEWLRLGLANASQIVAISHFTAQTIRQNLPDVNVVVVFPIVATERFIPAESPRQPIPPYRLLTVGRLAASERYKGHDQIITSLPALQQHLGAPIEYWIVGDGDDRPRLESLAHSVAASVRFWGRVSDDELVHLYQDCDIFVMPSSGEGFGIVYLEASACGKPVIGSSVGGATDAVEHGVTGLCVDPTDTASLHSAIIQLLRDPALASQMGQAGRTRVLRQFSADALDTALQGVLCAE